MGIRPCGQDRKSPEHGRAQLPKTSTKDPLLCHPLHPSLLPLPAPSLPGVRTGASMHTCSRGPGQGECLASGMAGWGLRSQGAGSGVECTQQMHHRAPQPAHLSVWFGTLLCNRAPHPSMALLVLRAPRKSYCWSLTPTHPSRPVCHAALRLPNSLHSAGGLHIGPEASRRQAATGAKQGVREVSDGGGRWGGTL